MAIAISTPPVWPSICVITAVAHAVFRRVLDPAFQNSGPGRAAVERQDVQINHVAGQVERDHHAGPKRQGKRQIAAGILDFSGGEGHVVPGVGGKQRAHLRDGQNSQRAHQNSAADIVQIAQAGVVPEVSAEVGGQRGGVAAGDDTEEGQPQQGRDFGGSENVLDHGAGADAEDIDDRQQDHDQDGDQVLGVQPYLHVAQGHWADFPGRDGRESREANLKKRWNEQRCRETFRKRRRRRR